MTEAQLNDLYRLTANRTCGRLTFVKIGLSLCTPRAELTEHEIGRLWEESDYDPLWFARAIEQAAKEKE
jgi:hypothetical protein